MTAPAVSLNVVSAFRRSEQAHRQLITLISLIVASCFVALLIFGMSYYRLEKVERAFSPKRQLLKPSGPIGISLAFVGVLMLCAIFLYPLRKRWRWLQRQGDSKHWLDYHLIFGIVAPISIAFHSAFKFRGLAGVAFWSMVAVAVSGLVGRYLYAQVLRESAAAETSLIVCRAMLESQTLVSQEELRRCFFRAPTADRISTWSPFKAVAYLALCDVRLRFHIVRFRARVLGAGAGLHHLGGLLSTGNAELEEVITLGRKEARLSRRLLFLSHAQRVFKLWHIVHKPFSYAFVVLAVLHIVVAMVFGFI